MSHSCRCALALATAPAIQTPQSPSSPEVANVSTCATVLRTTAVTATESNHQPWSTLFMPSPTTTSARVEFALAAASDRPLWLNESIPKHQVWLMLRLSPPSPASALAVFVLATSPSHPLPLKRPVSKRHIFPMQQLPIPFAASAAAAAFALSLSPSLLLQTPLPSPRLRTWSNLLLHLPTTTSERAACAIATSSSNLVLLPKLSTARSCAMFALCAAPNRPLLLPAKAKAKLLTGGELGRMKKFKSARSARLAFVLAMAGFAVSSAVSVIQAETRAEKMSKLAHKMAASASARMLKHADVWTLAPQYYFPELALSGGTKGASPFISVGMNSGARHWVGRLNEMTTRSRLANLEVDQLHAGPTIRALQCLAASCFSQN
jgi:hypothetical protein